MLSSLLKTTTPLSVTVQNRFALLKDLLKTIHEFEPETEQYEAVSATCMVLGCFGSAYAWPSAHLEERLPALQQAITLLTQMTDPSDDAWDF